MSAVPEEIELRVESIAGGGDGVAREESGRVVFAPRTAPGDRVRAEVIEEHSSYARARALEVLEAGPGRIRPPCPYYARCGGCQLQHLSRERELEAKRGIVRDAIERIGGRSVEVPSPITAGDAFGYRSRVTFTLRRSADGERGRGSVLAGYHELGDPGRIVDVDECPLAEPPIGRAWRQLRDGWGDGAVGLPAGEELRVTVRASSEGRIALAVRGGDPGEAGEPGRIAEAVEELSCYVWRPGDPEARTAGGGDRRTLAGEPTLSERWDGFDVALDPEAFTQVNRPVAGRMEEHLDQRVEPGPGRRLVDLYAGVGLRAVRWASRGAEVAACEVDERALAGGRRVARREGREVSWRAARVEECLPELLPADAAVVNPPRNGLSEEVARYLRDGSVAELAYVSCDPATLARDLDRLGERWRLITVQPFDAFPQTAHVETVAWLEAA